MKKTVLIVASCGLASGLALAGQEQEEGAYDPHQEVTQDQSESGSERPTDPSESTMGQQETGQEQQTTEYGTEQQTDPAYQAQQPHSQHGDDLTKMSASDLEGKTVKTATGEEIGEIDAIWTSSTNPDERIATVEVGGFLGIGEKTIAIPVSDLQQLTTGEEGVQTSMTRSTIEAQPEFEESGYSREGESQDESMPEQDEETSY